MIPGPHGALLTDDEAADLIGVRPGTIRKWRHKGWLEPYTQPGQRPILTHSDEVYRCERNRRQAATVPLRRLEAS